MSVVLMIYSRSACREFVLPALHNEEYSLKIDSEIFGLYQDVSLRMEENRGEWYFLADDQYVIYGAAGSSGSRSSRLRPEKEEHVLLLNSANYTLDLGRERLAVIVRFKETSFVSYRKYFPAGVSEITIGRAPGNMIQYSYSYQGNQYIGRNMAAIRLSGADAVLVDNKSKNGLYVNDRRVNGSRQLAFGDHIHIWGLDMVYLGKILAIREEEDLKVDPSCLKEFIPEKKEESHPGETEPYKRILYHRAPRSMEAIDTEPIEIEQPPSRKEIPDPNLMLTLGPSLTMAIPMALGSGLAIVGTRLSGGTASLFMYTGIIVAVGAATIGAFWALMNLNYNQKRAKQEETHRFEAYSEYLIRSSDKIKHSYVNNAEALRRMYPAASFCVTPEMETQNLLWGRNSTHADFLAHRVGMGDIPFQVQINVPKERFTLLDDSLNEKPRMIRDSYRTLHDVPICINLLQENIIGIVGGPQKEGAYEVFYDLVAQIAAQNSYTDVKMAFLLSGEGDHESHKEKWDFLRWLPHTWSQDRRMRYFACGHSEITDVLYSLSRILRDRSEQQKGASVTNEKHIYKPHYILFAEDSTLLEGEMINTWLTDRDADLGVTLVMLAENYEDLPNTCECIIGNEAGFRGLYRVREGTREKIVFDQVSPAMLNGFARHLSNLEVSEVEVGGDIPTAITFFEMYGVTRMEEFGVVDRWRKNRTYTSMRALVGHMAGGAPCYLDVHEKYHGPHGLVAGTTGSGKSETLQTYILSLAINFSPDDVGFFLIDYKGGGMANLFENLPHVMGTISNLSGNQVTRAMVSIKSENRRRQRLFNESGVNNINAYTQLFKNGEARVPVPHLFIIIDEFAELKREQPNFMKELISVAQVGRSLGVHLILATQKPAGTVDDNIWSNSKFRLCLRVQDRQDSMDMLHKPDAAYLTQAGRSYLQVGNDELYELFQSGWSGAVYDEEDANAQRTLATMLTGTGKAALMGSYVKRRQKENQKEKWIASLVEVLEKCDQGGIRPAGSMPAAEEIHSGPAVEEETGQGDGAFAVTASESGRGPAAGQGNDHLENDHREAEDFGRKVRRDQFGRIVPAKEDSGRKTAGSVMSRIRGSIPVEGAENIQAAVSASAEASAGKNPAANAESPSRNDFTRDAAAAFRKDLTAAAPVLSGNDFRADAAAPSGNAAGGEEAVLVSDAYGYTDENAGYAGYGEADAATLMDRFFALLHTEGIDYPDNDFNRRAVTFFIRLTRQAAEEIPGWGRLSSVEMARILLDMEGRKNGRLPEQKDRTQLDAVIGYLAQVAETEGYRKPQKLWLPVLPSVLPLEALTGPADVPEQEAGSAPAFDGRQWPVFPQKWSLCGLIGMYDDPASQAQEPLEINFTESGNIAVCGMQGSGRSTALQTILYSFARKYSPRYLGFYVMDFSSKMLACFEPDPHCGGVLYEEDTETVDKFFNMLRAELKRRRELFSGGNYYQYVMKNGVTLPAVIVAIDNYAGFREKTECAYDDVMMQLMRDSNACGIYFLLSAAGYNKDEIPNRMHDNIHYTITLEMMDQFAYGDALGVMRVPLTPESGIPGRGLASVSGAILEYQMSVAVAAGDDYQRGESISQQCRQWAEAWTESRIRRIPRIPAKPLWELFAGTREVVEMAQDGIHLPVGYLEATAEIYGIDLRGTYTWLVQGKNKNERRNVLQVLAKSAKLKKSLVTVIEPEGTQWRSFAVSEGFGYASGFEDYKTFFESQFVPDFVSRNKKKNALLAKDLPEEEVYHRMREDDTRVLIITDLCRFAKMLHTQERKLLEDQMTNLLDKGFLHNIYVFAGMNPDDRVDVLDNSIFKTFTAPRAGIHLGGRIPEQRIFDFSSMPFYEQNAPEKNGRGVTAPTDTEEWHRIVLPIA